MKTRKRTLLGIPTRLGIVLLLLVTALGVMPAPVACGTATLVGHWTFELGSELVDITGNFDDLVLNGATVANGQLDVSTSQWAIASNYTGPPIENKTLVSCLYLENLDVTEGSALTIDRVGSDHFDGIVYAECQHHRWMSGSNGYSRTQYPVPGYEEIETGQCIVMAITYENDGGLAHITLYRNGDIIGEYTQGAIGTWSAGDAEVFFGIRHGSTGGGSGNLDALIEEARIYAGVLSQAEIEALNLCPAVGGHTEPANLLALLWPWVALAAVVGLGIVGVAAALRKRTAVESLNR